MYCNSILLLTSMKFTNFLLSLVIITIILLPYIFCKYGHLLLMVKYSHLH